MLEQSCQALHGTGVMNAADCTAVHQATLATELRNTPVNNPQPTDAAVELPGRHTAGRCSTARPGPRRRSSPPAPAGRATASPAGVRSPTRNPAAWSTSEAAPPGSSSLTAAAPIALPAGQASYLFFQHWRVLQYDRGGRLQRRRHCGGQRSGRRGLPWVNGPTQTINGSGNPANGRPDSAATAAATWQAGWT